MCNWCSDTTLQRNRFKFLSCMPTITRNIEVASSSLSDADDKLGRHPRKISEYGKIIF